MDQIINDDIDIFKTAKRMRVIIIKANVLFPAQILTFDFGKEKNILKLLEDAKSLGEEVLVVSQKNPSISAPTPDDIYRVGVTGNIRQILRLPNDSVRVIIKGGKRMLIDSIASTSPYEVDAIEYGEPMPDSPESRAMFELVKNLAVELAAVNKKLNKDIMSGMDFNSAENCIAELVHFLNPKDVDKQSILEISSQYGQLEVLYRMLLNAKDLAEAERRIADRVKQSVDHNQKEYYLREQIKAIHTELGDDEEEKEKYLKAAEEKKLPQYAVEKVQKEIARMDKMAPSSPEAGIIRTYLEWILDLPWGNTSETQTDLQAARNVLDDDHYGLDKIKRRIVEYLAVHKLTDNHKGAILCFVGPPGVGKTSIVTSIARAAGRTLVQMSLGGVRDEAEIRGHRRTYIGAMPGRILSGMKSAGVNNPVFLLDEIDKMSSDFRGDPASAMLEVLDPNQNCEFKDHYLEIPYDLSKVMFVATANTTESIPAPLLDRMEIIELSGYTYAEKLQIAKRYLVPKQERNSGMEKCSLLLPDETLMGIIANYTRESGVRALERQIQAVIRKLAVKHLETGETTFTVMPEDLQEYLGAPIFRDADGKCESRVGVATGLAWTSVGGVTLKVETALIGEGNGELMLTGNMGDVMKESARIAYSLVKSKASQYGFELAELAKSNLHIHIPEGATPKDGPSAGITLSTAIMSRLTGRPVDGKVAMTGEITLSGRVLPIGGLKEKSLAAFRSGIKTLLIPQDNVVNLDDVPQEVKDNIEIIPVSDIDEVFKVALL